MRYLAAFSCVFFLLLSCNRTTPSVFIDNQKDTVLIGETYVAMLSVPSIDSISPIFYIIMEDDSIPIPYFENEGYAVFQAEGAFEGSKKYEGTVVYLNESGKRISEDYLIEFYVKE